MGDREIDRARRVAVIGGGPAGLMAAEVIAGAGVCVTVFDRMASMGRKLLMAGRGGLNLTHSEPAERFCRRYGAASAWMRPHLDAFPPAAAIAWCEGLGQPIFVGSSGRVFPRAMKASPLLRAWLARLAGLGVRFLPRARWTGWNEAGELAFAQAPPFAADATVLALGGASWPRLGSDAAWTALLPEVALAPLRPANCGFVVAWSERFRQRHAGAPLKRIALSFAGQTARGEAVIVEKGIEGGAVYALSAPLRDAIAREGVAVVRVDLRPDLDAAALAARLAAPRGSASLSTFLAKRIGLAPVAVGLVQEALHAGATEPLPALVKALPLRLTAPFAMARAISTAGGIALAELDEHLMLRRRPGVFAAGEMLDWEAPTGGYLLQACLATGAAAGRGVVAWLRTPR
ncbi:MAG: TIGR03862 family flavoprotein [Alphaproteobacteria bacterium]|nr:TIGR03862 family flavoprotein [Alphaproteobacteria bacterium]